MTSSTISNPLLQIQFQIPFDQIRAENVEPAIAGLLADTRAELERLTSEPGARTFANTMQRLDHLTERLEHAMQIVRNLEAVATTPELRAAYNAVQPQVSEFYSVSYTHLRHAWSGRTQKRARKYSSRWNETLLLSMQYKL